VQDGVLDDYADLGLGLLDLFEATSKVVYLQRAVELANRAIERFGNPSGAWFLTATGEQTPLGRRFEVFDSVEPSGNSSMASLLERLAAITDRHDLQDSAGAALRGYSTTMRDRGLEMAGWLDADLVASGPTYDVVVCGDDRVPATEALFAAWSSLLAPWTTGVRSPCNGPSGDLERLAPATVGKRTKGRDPVAYVCTRAACKLPTSEPARLRADVLVGWIR
jgi:uncharacterized protein YyaL (SSP411 family)